MQDQDPRFQENALTPPQLPQTPRDDNQESTLAITGFVFSIIGLTGACACLCPVAIVMCWMAMQENESTLAKVGLILSIIGTVLMFLPLLLIGGFYLVFIFAAILSGV